MGRATDAHQKFLGRIGEDLIEFLFLRAGFDVQRMGREFISFGPDGKIKEGDILSPDFRVSKNGVSFLLEVTVSNNGELGEEKRERVRQQCRKWPDLQIILVHGSHPDGNRHRGDDFNPFEVWSREEREWILLCPENWPFHPTKTAVEAAIKRWWYFLAEPHQQFYLD